MSMLTRAVCSLLLSVVAIHAMSDNHYKPDKPFFFKWCTEQTGKNGELFEGTAATQQGMAPTLLSKKGDTMKCIVKIPDTFGAQNPHQLCSGLGPFPVEKAEHVGGKIQCTYANDMVCYGEDVHQIGPHCFKVQSAHARDVCPSGYYLAEISEPYVLGWLSELIDEQIMEVSTREDIGVIKFQELLSEQLWKLSTDSAVFANGTNSTSKIALRLRAGTLLKPFRLERVDKQEKLSRLCMTGAIPIDVHNKKLCDVLSKVYKLTTLYHEGYCMMLSPSRMEPSKYVPDGSDKFCKALGKHGFMAPLMDKVQTAGFAKLIASTWNKDGLSGRNIGHLLVPASYDPTSHTVAQDHGDEQRCKQFKCLGYEWRSSPTAGSRGIVDNYWYGKSGPQRFLHPDTSDDDLVNVVMAPSTSKANEANPKADHSLLSVDKRHRPHYACAIGVRTQLFAPTYSCTNDEVLTIDSTGAKKCHKAYKMESAKDLFAKYNSAHEKEHTVSGRAQLCVEKGKETVKPLGAAMLKEDTFKLSTITNDLEDSRIHKYLQEKFAKEQFALGKKEYSVYLGGVSSPAHGHVVNQDYTSTLSLQNWFWYPHSNALNGEKYRLPLKYKDHIDFNNFADSYGHVKGTKIFYGGCMTMLVNGANSGKWSSWPCEPSIQPAADGKKIPVVPPAAFLCERTLPE